MQSILENLQVDLVSVGFNITDISVSKQTKMVQYTDGSTRPADVLDESGEPIAIEGSGIYFLSTDGFKTHLDFTSVWGVMPEQCPDIIRTFGNLKSCEQKVIIPQSESICRNSGAKLSSQELLIGESRQAFQDEAQEEFQKVLVDKNISLLYGLVRHIYIPQEARTPVQAGYIADELKLTRDEEKKAAIADATLKEEKQKVLQSTVKVTSDTKKKVAECVAEGDKVVQETEAETKTKVAAIDKQIAELAAKKTVALGEAENKSNNFKPKLNPRLLSLL
jgi:hypothetical protein